MQNQPVKVKDFLSLLRKPENITFRTKDGYDICTTASDSIGINPYKDNIITEWFAFSSGALCCYIDIKGVKK